MNILLSFQNLNCKFFTYYKIQNIHFIDFFILFIDYIERIYNFEMLNKQKKVLRFI